MHRDELQEVDSKAVTGTSEPKQTVSLHSETEYYCVYETQVTEEIRFLILSFKELNRKFCKKNL
jgi:hypothetical protein